MFRYYRSTQYRPKLKERDNILAGSWIRCTNPSEEEIGALLSYGIEHDVIHDSLDPYEVPRIEQSDGWVYFITRLPDTSDAYSDFTTPILFALDERHIITVSRKSLDGLWGRFIKNVATPTTQQSKFFMLMIDEMVRQYNVAVTDINRRTRATSANITTITTKHIAEIVEYERKLNDYLDALIPTNDAVERILSGKYFPLYEDDRDIVEDLSVDLEQIIARSKSVLRTITNLRDSYRAVMDTRLNETMRNLTLITICLTIPTMIAGLFGMNVDIPFVPESPAMFWIIASVSAVAAIVFVVYFSRRK